MAVPAEVLAAALTVVDKTPKGLYVDGEWRAGRDGAVLPVEDPATGTTVAEVADASVEDGRDALAAAARAQAGWAATPPRERGEVLRRAFDLIIERRDDLARMMTLEMGKAFAESQAEVSYAAEFLRWFAEEAVRIDGGYLPAPGGNSRVVVMRQPVGPCLLVTPWNFPMAMGTRKIGPALAAGCTVVVKPAKQTPLSMLALVRILEEAGLPRGVVNVITTSQSGRVTSALLTDERLRKLSFTGSTPVGRTLLAQSADRVLRTSMELGGNAPFLVFADADLDLAVEGAVQAKMRNVGEACTAANRFYVHRSVASRFVEALAERLGGLRVGHGLDPSTDVGPLIDGVAVTSVAELVADATQAGAAVVTGGGPVEGTGHFFAPTVLSGVPDDARCIREEIFGPVAPVVVFDDEDEAVGLANASEYGLAAYVFTENLGRGLRVTERLESGMVGLNQGVISNPAAPFGGVKQSGLGREGGTVGIDEYLTVKYAAVRAPW
ncbi:NAD-dependent succinate-semialdehyde dehydrogenase [Verrucosispora sp. NA02020]|uniref:NAD-dependent succinate-semialdehyde dehydrogenase n=1 Tax=Verrucosispora sp. NA02020 TaxID=2742132 RepID=UPI0015902E0F|nr:NAD-dependent succinate-semialdehyde dehydrogenase [Verrucosispora sp. NA02020]QKW13924.1 NAD-dependent succinate-semialdehyde dehydrogenase [Verrucosispora sp. NA02020]